MADNSRAAGADAGAVATKGADAGELLAVEALGVRFSYDGASLALDGVDLQVRAGEFVCVLGGNGSGKSTFAKHVNALLRPDAGRVRTCGFDTADPELVYDVRSSAGMVFQNPDDQLVATLVEADVAFGPENLGVSQGQLAPRVADALREVGLVGFEEHETHALSGGQKQRVAIAGVLAMQPRVLVLDEASAMLDPRGRAGLMKVCRALNAQGMTIIMITHVMEEAAQADRVVVFDAGRVALQGTPQEVFSQAEALAKLNLELPPSVELGLVLRAAGVDAPIYISEAAEVDALAKMFAGHGGAPVSSGGPQSAPASGAASAGEVLIELRDVSYSYEPSVRERSRKHLLPRPGKQAKWGNDPNEVWALRHVSLQLHAGEFLGIAGHTGGGKSTLIQHLNGLVNPTEGSVLVQGRDLREKAASAAAKQLVGMVFQYPEHQLFAETVFDDVAFGPRNLGLSEPQVHQRVNEALASVGLYDPDLLQKSPFELSGGQQRRVAFAGVLAMNPQVLVLDEPAAGLDPAARKSFLGLIKKLHQERGLTVVMVSHSMDDLAALCTRVALLNEGRLLRTGAPQEIFQNEEELKQIGLGLPAAQRMAAALQQKGVPLPKRLYTTNTLAKAIASLSQGRAEQATAGPAARPQGEPAPQRLAAPSNQKRAE